MIRQAKAQGMKCCYCLRTMAVWDHSQREATPQWAATKDHVIPKSFGGSDTQVNMVICCLTCNSERAELPADLFAIFKVWQREGEPEL